MITADSISRQALRHLPENGYESPRLPENEGRSVGNRINRNRDGRTSAFRGENRRDLGESERGAVEEVETKKLGFRDRVGCYTWTWFTMNMATGGIANVLHSSNRPGCERKHRSHSNKL